MKFIPSGIVVQLGAPPRSAEVFKQVVHDVDHTECWRILSDRFGPLEVVAYSSVKLVPRVRDGSLGNVAAIASSTAPS